MELYKGKSLYSLQTEKRDELSKDLQSAISIHPPGYFLDKLNASKNKHADKIKVKEAKSLLNNLSQRLKESADTIPFTRYRALDIDWNSVVPTNIYDKDLDLQFTKKMFEDSWGQKPDDQKTIHDFYSQDITANDYLVESENKSIKFSGLKIPLLTLNQNACLFEKDDEGYLLIGKELNFIKDYDNSWDRVKRIYKVKVIDKFTFDLSYDPISVFGHFKPITLPNEINPLNRESDAINLANLSIESDPPNLPQIGNPIGSDVGLPPHRWRISIDRPIDLKLPTNFESEKDLWEKLEKLPDSAIVNIESVKNKVLLWLDGIEADYKREELLKRYNSEELGYKLSIAIPKENEYREIALGPQKGNSHEINATHAHTLTLPKYEFAEIPSQSHIAIDKASNRQYLLQLRKGSEFENKDIATNKDWEEIWNEHIVGVQLLHPSDINEILSEENSSISDRYSIGRNEARLILEKYRLLVSEKDVLSGHISVVEKLFDSLSASSEAALSINYDELSNIKLNSISKRLLDLKKRALEIDQLLHQLQADASELGYKLFLKSPDNGLSDNGQTYSPYKHESKAPDHIKNLKIPIPQPGNLYKVTIKALTWTEVHTKRVKRKERNGRTWYGRRKYKWVTKTIRENIQRRDSYTSYIPINPGEEIWETHKNQLIAAGKKVFILKKLNGEYISNDGPSLIDLMERAIVDEEYRKNLVVFIPVYDYSFASGNVITHYDVINRPMPGMSPISLPQIHLKEHLEYRRTLAGTELGELSSSISLSPGEKREITYQRRFENKLDKRKTIKNFLDITTGNDTSFEQKLEEEVRTESNDSSSESSNLSGQASGTNGQVSGSASYSENSQDSSSLSEFTKDFQSTADKAARRYSKSVKDETVEDISEIISSSNEESVSMSIENINQGVSLNLMFHKLYNAYYAGVFMKDFEIQITHPIEVIQDTGITHKVNISRSKSESLYEYLNDFIQVAAYGVSQESESNIFKLVCQSITQVINNDYLRDLNEVFSMSSSNGADSLSPAPSDVMKSILINNHPISTHFISLPSKATYVDSLLGVNPSTEPYSEAMRMEQLRRASMETNLIEAQKELLERNSQLNLVKNNTFTARKEENQVQIQFESELSQGNWLAMHKNSVIGLVNSQNETIPTIDNDIDINLIRIVDLVNLKEIRQN
ncbi:hypothetical protein [Aureibacter tunicatorum]|uniref:Uncharacterized protein n=1 Tax=Aureibacter tunicatorum TaxID=866807 RepID=A0AAE3XRB9_9BACT|nr:hypothetical protein [Aureibacter tunicatorum]MDR6240599.1 hypothetical protein [Aureibacter tunicatorum]BDD06540.1 hypothetical protein AUTU_40230 [Aureibacter tunicatorum]